MANPSTPVVHTIPTGGTLSLQISKSALAKVAVSGTDLVLVLKDGTQHVLRDFAMQSMLQPGLKVVFAGTPMSAGELMGSVGKVAFAEMANVVAMSAPAEAAPAAPATPPAPADNEPPLKPPAAEAAASDGPPPTPAPPPPPTDGLATPAADALTKDADFRAPEAPPPPVAPPVLRGQFDSPPSPSTPPNTNPPAPPPPPPETIAIDLVWRNLTGQTTASQDGKTLITGSGGSARSATDLSSEAQAEREIILGTSGDDVIVGDNTSQLGSGFARALDIQLSAKLALEVKTLLLSGLPAGISVVGGTARGSGWEVVLPADFGASGNRASVVLQYPVAADGQPFAPAAFEVTISATGLMDGKPIDGVRLLPAMLRDVQAGVDMAYSTGGKDGMVLAAFGLGDEIHAGSGNDVVSAGVGHDMVFGDAGNDSLDGEAGNDVLSGGAGADRLLGGTGNDTALYGSSEAAVVVDLEAGTGSGGDADGDTLAGIENLQGSSHGDTLRGDAGGNRLEAGAGDDLLDGRGGADTLDGGDGDDTADYGASAAGVSVSLASGSASGGAAEGDTLVSIEHVIGSAHADRLVGTAGGNLLDGGAGDDQLDGGTGADTLLGGTGTDTAAYGNSAGAVFVSLATGQGSGGDADGDRLQDIENLGGSRHADELTGNDSANVLAGGAGDDWLEGNGGADTLVGGEGRDTASYLEAQAGVVANLENPTANTGDAQGDTFQDIENLEGSEFDDLLVGDGQANQLIGGPGNDQLQGRGGNDTLLGGVGRDSMDGGDGTDTVTYAGAGEAVVVNLATGAGAQGDAEGDTYAAVENVVGTRYADRLTGDAGANQLDGGRGADTLVGGGGADILVGGDGADMADYSGSAAAVRVDLAAGTVEGGDAAGDRYESIENLGGTGFDDRLAGDASANALVGGDGADVLDGRAGNDTLQGGAGDDLLTGGSGADVLAGGAGSDTASYADSTASLVVNLATGTGAGGEAEGDALSGIEHLEGGSGNDSLTGTADANRLLGGKGDDLLEGGAGADLLDGGEGSNTASYAGAAAGVVVSLLQPDLNTGDAAGDVLVAIAHLAGSAHADTLVGTADANRLDGAGGDDLLVGGAGADTLVGGAGSDTTDYTASTAAVVVDLAAGTGAGGDAEGDSLADMENVLATTGNDRLLGNASANALVGGAGDDWLEGRGGADVLDGGSGDDTASYAGATAGVAASLANAADNTGDAAGDSFIGIEHLTGSAWNDTLVGDAGDNRLTGGDGDDILQGGAGADILGGGAGSDTASYAGAAAGLLVSLRAPDSNTGDAAGDVLQSIENLIGSAGDDTLVGTDAANRLDGGAGNDLLLGGAGADTLDGGSGVDSTRYDTSLAAVVVHLGNGTGQGGDAQGDRLAGIENLLGSAFDDSLTGNASANRLEGGDGHDALDGAGGADLLIGGAGDDVYTVDNAGDTVQEAAGEGTDTVRASVSHTLTAQVENLVLTGTDAIDGSGNALANSITGNAGNNLLDGGAGADALAGGAGDDTYLVDNAADSVTEDDGAGSDTVVASVSWTLGENTEHLTLTGSAALSATGNTLANQITGNSGDNLLTGGAGADVLAGGAGSDTAAYTGSADGVAVNLATGQGTGGDAEGDMLSGIEHLVGSAGADRLSGNAEANTLTGAAGDDVLDGGAGADTLVGGDGSDTASYSRATSGLVASLAAPSANTSEAAGDSYGSIENLTGSAGADTLGGDGDANRLDGGAGDDLLTGGGGADSLVGGAGSDTVNYTASAAAVVVDLLTGNGSGGDAEGDTFSGVEHVLGSAGNDSLAGTADDNRLVGGSGNDALEGGAGADTLDGGAGSDTASYALAADGVTASLANAADNAGEAAGDTYADIEHLTGSAWADSLTGDADDNRLDGGTGDDTLQGGAGADVLVGGTGSDTASYANADHGLVASLLASDTNTFDAAGDTYSSIENLTGTALDDQLTGNDSANRLSGGSGTDWLSGGGGADVLDGGAGQDTASYASARAGVAVNLTTGLGQGGDAQGDRLSAVEHLVGSAYDDVLTGSAGANQLEGGDGADQLDGLAGADTLLGGDGDDTYGVDNVGDSVTEATGEGSDTVRASIAYSLGANLENLVLLGVDHLAGTGNALANSITGNAGNNLLDGGAGADALAGGAGDDTYLVDNAADSVTEDDGAGSDTVVASVSWTLGENTEHLTLTGSAALSATGNALANQITGNSGDNLLTGGAGADVLAGGAGSDTAAYSGSADGVVVNLATGQGTGGDAEGDLLSGIEHLVGSAGADRLSGNAEANTLTGAAGDDVLDGGAGADTLVGGDGSDTASYSRATSGLVASLAAPSANTGEAAGDSYGSIENLTGSAGADTLGGDGDANRLDGGAGDDLLTGGGGADSLVGGAGSDTVNYTASAAAVVVDLLTGTGSGGDAEGDTFSGVEHVLGSAGNDSLAGTADDNRLVGGSGNDVLEGGAGADTLDGGAGSDTASYARAADGVIASLLSAGANTGDAAGDAYLGIEHLRGSAWNDSLTGDGGDNRLDGGDGDDTLVGGAGADALVGGAGSDTASYAGGTQAVAIHLASPDPAAQTGDAAGDTFSSIENLVGTSFDDQLGGTDAANRLTGGGGNDWLSGGGGADTLDGGAGTDTASYASALSGVGVNLLTGLGQGGDAQGDRLTGVENLVGSDFDDSLTGNASANRLTGGDGSDTLDGGGGADTLIGGLGDDVYTVDNAGDVVTEASGEGTDTVRSSIATVLVANVENGVLIGLDDVDLTGNALANELTGNAGANRIDGGAGADAMTGGAGDDTYIADNAGDTVTEDDGAGTDSVLAAVIWRLGDNIEDLTLTGSADTDGTGNALANQITGNSGNNRLDGGAGADRLAGGAGDDIYTVDHVGDLVSENSGEGTDEVRATVSTTLGANLERLTLLGTGGINATGNALANVLTGNSGANVLDGGAGADTLAGGAGNDTYRIDNAGDLVTEAGGEGTDTVESTLALVLGANLENGTLLGSDDIDLSGNALDNRLTGNDGDNLIDGGTGADALAGGLGSDTYGVDDIGDTVTEDAGAGTDTVRSSVSHALAANIENLALLGVASINATGNELANQLTGNDGNNRLDGGRGADRMAGGDGDDIYVVDNLGDLVTELPGEGNDSVRASVTYGLTLNVENLTLTGALAINGTGNDLDNLLVGNAAANTLDGGTGADTLQGGGGDDIYIVDNPLDVVNENPGEGIDTVRASVSTLLADNVDHLLLTGTASVNATGNALDNNLTGNAGDNVLDGGEGVDLLTGGDGNDTYWVDDGGDLVVETGGVVSGTDTVNTTVSYALAANVEHGVLRGASDIDLYGNALDNNLTGNAGNNLIDGGAGADTLAGGAGDDIYVVDSLDDVVTEGVGAGTDTVRTTLGYVLGANLENLLLEGEDAAALTGNALANRLTGNAANNTLDGGAGADVMTGGLGDDSYVVDSSLDQVVEQADEGDDDVTASVSHTLAANVERLTLTGTAHLDGTGNVLNNTLTGNRGNNLLDGGLGTDVLAGGVGDDTYLIDNIGDVAVEVAGEGTDTVRSSVSWTLGLAFEHLQLTGSADADAVGHSGTNTITGNSGANTIVSGGGADVLAGGAGADTFYVSDLGYASLDGGAGHDALQLDGLGVNSLADLLGNTRGVELLDFSGGHTDLVQIRAVDVNAAGFLGSDANNRLDIVLDGPTAGNDALLLDSSEYNNVTSANSAPSVTLANGSTGRLLTSTVAGKANLAIDFGTLVLPTLDELTNVWGRVADPTLNNVAGLATWLDATDLDGDGQSEGLSEAGVLNASGNLNAWVDKSGRGNNFTQTTNTSWQPQLVANGMNGLATVRFDGSDTLLSQIAFNQSYTVFVVGAMQGTQNGRLVASSNTNEFIGWYGGVADRFYSAGWVTALNTPIEPGVAKLYTATGLNGTGYLWNDGTRLPLNSSTNFTNEMLGNVQLGAFNGNNRDQASKGDVSELMVFDHALTDGERRVVEAYLHTKWGVNGGNTGGTTGIMGTIALDRTWTGGKLLYGTAGNDTLSVSYTLSAARGTGRVDSVVFGGAGNDVINGSDRVDALYGGDGNDTLNGGTGNDWMAGGGGNDTYTVDSSDDTVLEEANAGTDTVNSAVSYALSAHIENLTLTGTAHIDATGNAQANTITGNAGNNRIDGGGGADTMVGGGGNDTYTVDNLGDVISDTAGTDTVITALSGYVLGAAVENLQLIGNGPTTATGNALDNALRTSLFGGVATFAGGLGNDTYVIDQDYAGTVRTDHVFIENPGEGTDTIQLNRTGSLTLMTITAPINVENINIQSTYQVNAVGSAGNNYIIGSNNWAIASGNPHSLAGMAGDDTYRVYLPVTTVTEALGDGNDTIEAANDFRAAANVENITAWNHNANISNRINLFGNAVDNLLTGNWGYNRLDGGTGNDVMVGDKGDDTYVVDSVGDTITDTLGVDTVETGLASYTLASTLEKLVFTSDVAHTGTGNAGNNLLHGSTANDTLTGLDGNDVLIGGGGTDSLVGGNGNDLLRSLKADFAGGLQAGLRAEYFNNASFNFTGAPVLVRQEAVSINTSGSPGPGVNVDNFSVRWTGNLTVSATGNYTFRLQSDDNGRLYIDNQLVLLNGYGTGDSLPLSLAAGTHSITAWAAEGGGTATAILSWKTPGDATFSVVPLGQLSYGEALLPDSGGDTLTGGAGDDWLVGGDAVDTLVGGAGNDNYVVTSTADTLTELAGEGTDTVLSTVSYSLSGTQLENLQLTGTDAVDAIGSSGANVLTGNRAANTLDGGDGNDTLVGKGGADVLLGGAGNDSLQAGGGSLLDGGDGNDTLSLVGLWTPDALAGKALWLDAADLDGDGLQEGWAEGGLDLGGQVRVWADKSGLGRHAVQTDVDNQPLLQLGTQNGLPAIRFDGTGDGLAALGLPTMTGNTNSLFWVQNPTGGRSYMPLHSNNGVNAWALIVNANDGRTDLVGNGNTQTAASYYTDGALAGFTNSASVYTRLNGAAHVVASVNQPFSWNGQMTIANGYSNTSLQGDNTLYWNYAGTMTEILVTSQTLSQADRELVEGYLAWKWGTQAFLPAAHPYKTAAPTLAAATGGTLLGGDGTDTLTGGAGHDSLDGGAGTDTLTGGLGNDTYTIDTLADVLVEAAGGGTDTVVTELGFTLATHFENLTLTGSAAVDGTGNAADNLLTGNDADNVLTGLGGDDTLDGGLGADTLVGGLGDDSYNVDQADDVVVEAANEGFDLIRSAISLTLGDHVEALLLTGTAALDGTGNSLNNSLSGNSAANTLDGGTGGDTLAGGGGDDRYLVDDSLDTVVEVANEGTDLVMASVSHTLSANVEQLVLTGSDDLNGGGNSMANRITGNAGDNTLDGGAAADTLIGGAGNDTYLVDNASDVVTELAGEGNDSVRSSASFVLSVNVENLQLTGSSGLSGTGNAGNNLLTGNTGANTLRGHAGDDTLDGGAGNDNLIGGAGDDIYVVAQAGDITTELAGEGNDTVLASLSWVLADQVDNLVLSGTALNGTGNALANQITGTAAANQLDGDAGADTLTGGAGNDTYVVDNLGDVVVEAADEGTDTVLASVTTTLSADVEHLQLTGASAINGIGNALDNTLTGNAAANTLQGGAGNDGLDGGAGADVLVGGSGDDAYTVDNSADVVVELSGEGDDTVRASASFVLGNHVETLVLTGTAAIQGTGNALDNTLVGNSGNNQLDGGAGADTLVGGAGDDTYRVDQAGDVVVEAAGEGSDTVQSAVSYLLGADLEHLTLTGNAAVDGTGNEADNTLLGNGAANALTGADGNDLLDGGAGADTLAGCLGDDHYIVDDAGDSVAEALGEGTDQVDASVSHTLAAFLETLQLTGSADIDGTGNAQANTLTGNSGANVLTGGGGVDSLLGAGGNDTLVLADAAAVAQVDGGGGDDWLQFTAPGLSVDLASLMGRVGNIEGLRLDNGADDLDVQLDALSVASLTDARHELNLRLDNGDTLTIGGTYLEIGRHTDPDGHETVDYALFGSADTTAPPVSTIHVQWLAAGAPA